MTKFHVTIVMCLLMALLVPFTDILAVSEDTPLYTHFLYVAGHDGYVHFAINAWSALVMHNLFRWYRVLAAYTFAVGVSFLGLTAQPMVGASVFTCFFFGFTAPYLWKTECTLVILTVALMLLTCILPGFAGIPHISAYLFGVLFSFLESYIRRIRHYLNE